MFFLFCFVFSSYKNSRFLSPRKNKPNPPREQGERFPSRDNSPSPSSRQKSKPRGSQAPLLFPFFPQKSTQRTAAQPPNLTDPPPNPAASPQQAHTSRATSSSFSLKAADFGESGGNGELARGSPKSLQHLGTRGKGSGGEHGPRTHPAGGVLPSPRCTPQGHSFRAKQASNEFFPR